MRIPTLLLIIITLNGCIIFPMSEVYLPKIEGVVVDENGTPIGGARVTRIENKSVKGSEGISTSVQVLTDSVLTDVSGKFVLESQSKLSWVQGGMQSSVFFCFGNFEVRHNGYTKYESSSGEYEQKADKSDMCKNIKFESKVVLNKNN